jgi:hypothetical protein
MSQTGWLKNLFSYSSENGTSEIKVLAGLVSPEASFLGF